MVKNVEDQPMPKEDALVDFVHKLLVPISAIGGVFLTIGIGGFVGGAAWAALPWFISGVAFLSTAYHIDRNRRFEEKLWKAVAELNERRVIACDARWGMDAVNEATKRYIDGGGS